MDPLTQMKKSHKLSWN